jgi:hypothetical protein
MGQTVVDLLYSDEHTTMRPGLTNRCGLVCSQRWETPTRLKQFEAVALPEGLEHAMERNGWKLVGFRQVDLTPAGSFNGPAGLLNTYTLKKGDRTTVLNHAPNARHFNSALDEYVKVNGGSLVYADTLRGYKALRGPTGQDRQRTVSSEPEGGEVTWRRRSVDPAGPNCTRRGPG